MQAYDPHRGPYGNQSEEESATVGGSYYHSAPVYDVPAGDHNGKLSPASISDESDSPFTIGGDMDSWEMENLSREKGKQPQTNVLSGHGGGGEGRGLYTHPGDSRDSVESEGTARGGYQSNDEHTMLNPDDSHVNLIGEKGKDPNDGYQPSSLALRKKKRSGGLFGICANCCMCCPAPIQRLFGASSVAWSIMFGIFMLLVFVGGAAITYFTTAYWTPAIVYQANGIIEQIALDSSGFNFTSNMNITLYNWNFWTNKVVLTEAWAVFNDSHYFGYGRLPMTLEIKPKETVLETMPMLYSYVAAQDDADFHILKQLAVDCGPGNSAYYLPFKIWENTQVRILNMFNLQKKMGQEHIGMHCGPKLVAAIRDMMKIKGVVDPNTIDGNGTSIYAYQQPVIPSIYEAIPAATSPGIPVVATLGQIIPASTSAATTALTQDAAASSTTSPAAAASNPAATNAASSGNLPQLSNDR